MSHNLLPIHQFTVFDKQEILNRMECLVNNQPEPCINYCNMQALYHKNVSSNQIYKCYEELKIPLKYYGRKKCAELFNPKTNYDGYFKCLQTAKVQDLTMKEYCNQSQFKNLTLKLDCLMGKLMPEMNHAPIDFEFCLL